MTGAVQRLRNALRLSMAHSDAATHQTQQYHDDRGDLIQVLVETAVDEWKCKAQPTADPPQDCDWPMCGCDPAADRFLMALAESGIHLMPAHEISALRDRIARLEVVCRELNPGAYIP